MSTLMPFTSTKPRLLTQAYITLDSRSDRLPGKYRQTLHWQKELLTFAIAGAGCLPSSHLPSQQMAMPPTLSFQRAWGTAVHMLIFLKFHPWVPLTRFSFFKPLFFFLSKIKTQPFCLSLIRNKVSSHSFNTYFFEFQE